MQEKSRAVIRAAMLLIGGSLILAATFYFVSLLKTETTAERTPPQRCLPYSSKVANLCVLTETPIILSTEEPTVAGQFEFCYLKPDYAVLVTKRLGVNTFEFKSGSGAFPIRYKMVRREELVNGQCPKTL